MRPATEPSDKLLVYFQGGGACWDGASCAARGEFASQFDVSADEAAEYTDGIFAWDNPANPLADFNTVFVSYCSGDVFTGDAEVSYTEPEALTVYHYGYRNASAVLEWTFANAPAPSQVVVAGSSAGGYGATVYAAPIMAQYADVPAVLLADASAGIMPAETDALTTWNSAASLGALLGEDLSPESLVNRAFITTAAQFPQNSFGQYNNFLDAVQVAFYGYMTGRDVQAGGLTVFQEVAGEWSMGLLMSLTGLTSMLTNFDAFTAGGILHTVLLRPEFYTLTASDVVMRDWFVDLLAGQAETVGCNLTSGECVSGPTG